MGLVVLSAAAGVLMAGVAIPAIGAVGQITNGTVSAYDSLPSDFTISPLAQASRILDADGNVIATPYDENRVVVPLDKISPIMQKAQIAIEDNRFYQHGAVDLRGVTRAFVSNLQNNGVQGGSTLTQEYVKITMQENALRQGNTAEAKAILYDRSLSRKLQEMKYAQNVEENYTKDQILAGYLNLVNYGDQAYGVEAAARDYFGVHASQLTLVQSALLAGIVQQPNGFNPRLHPQAAQTRRDVVLDRMQQLGIITEAQASAAKKITVKSMLHAKQTPSVCLTSSQPYFCDFVLTWLEQSPEMSVLGSTPQQRHDAIYQDGLTIKTTLKPSDQKIAQAELDKAIPVNNKENLGGGVTIIQPGTGHILAMVQASTFNKNQVNWNVDQKYHGSVGWQFGSTAKMFALVTALEHGMPVNANVFVPAAGPSVPHVFTASDFHDACSANRFEVRNDYPNGNTTMSLAHVTAASINSAFANLVISLGACTVRDTMTRMGLHTGAGTPISSAPADITLGSGSTTTMSLASAYATLAANGTYCAPFPVTSITGPDKKALDFKNTDCKQVVDPDVAAGVTQLLHGPLLPGGTAAGVWNMSARPAAGKTGTTNNENQGWFVGYTPQLATAVWTGNLIPADSHGQLLTLNGKCFGSYGCRSVVFGGTIAAPVWAKIMQGVSTGMPVKSFPAPSSKILYGSTVPLPSVVGQSVSSAMATLQGAGFAPYVAGQVASTYPAGVVASTQPSGQATAGAAIGLYVSNGVAPAPTAPPSTSPTQTPAPPPRGRPGPGPGGTTG